ncbi:MAG: FtsX-like permease family protein [Bacteroidota bacterium]
MFRHILKLIWNRKSKNALIIVEIFFAFIILFSVLTFAFYQLNNYREPLGFVTQPLWVTYINLENRDSATIVATKRLLKRELEQHPKIEKVSWTGYSFPFGSTQSIYGNDNMGFYVMSHLYRADASFKEVAGIQMRAGRWFDESDAQQKYKPIVLTQQVVDDYFENRPILDSIISMDGERKVIGIAENFKYLGQFEPTVPLTFTHQPADDPTYFILNIRLAPGVGAAFEEELHRSVQELAKVDNLYMVQIEQLRLRQNKQTLIPIIVMLVVCGFLILNVALGLFGLLWYNISKRRGEIGLRRVVGAFKSHIAWQFIVEILLIAGTGIALATLFCIQVPLMEFFELPPRYFYQSIVVSTLFILVLVLICALYPSRQAAQITPADALREE